MSPKMRHLASFTEGVIRFREVLIPSRTRHSVIALWMTITLFSANLHADQTGTMQPIDIEADEFTVYLADEKAIWQGNVVASQGNYTFRTSMLTLHLEQIGGNPAGDTPDAEGNSDEPSPRAFSLSAQQVQYNLDEGTVVGQGDSELRRGDEVLRANRITYQLAERIAYGVPESHGRVSVKFYGNPKRPVIPGTLGNSARGAD